MACINDLPDLSNQVFWEVQYTPAYPTSGDPNLRVNRTTNFIPDIWKKKFEKKLKKNLKKKFKKNLKKNFFLDFFFDFFLVGGYDLLSELSAYPNFTPYSQKVRIRGSVLYICIFLYSVIICINI